MKKDRDVTINDIIEELEEEPEGHTVLSPDEEKDRLLFFRLKKDERTLEIRELLLPKDVRAS